MKIEFALARDHNAKNDIAVRESPPKIWPREEVVARRRLCRTEISDLIDQALKLGKIVEFAVRMPRVSLAVAGACAQFGAEPQYTHFAKALKDSLEDAHKRFDRALLINDADELRISAFQIELAIYGAVASIGFPYNEVLKYIAACYTKGGEVDLAEIAKALKRAGLEVTDA